MQYLLSSIIIGGVGIVFSWTIWFTDPRHPERVEEFVNQHIKPVLPPER